MRLLLLALLALAACRSEPPAPQVDAPRLADAVERARAIPRLHALLVAVDGQTVVAERFRGASLDAPVNVKSASKSILASVVGAAIAEGILESVEQPLVPLLDPARVPSPADPRLAGITVGHALAMQAGLEPTSGAGYGRWAVAADPVRYTLSRPFVDAPGGGMLYSTGTSHLLAAALTEASGESLLALTRRLLTDPLGATLPPWTRDPQGVYLGGNEMHLSARDLLAYGEMHRLGGRHVRAPGDTLRVLPEAWVAEMWTPRGRSPTSGFAYGYGWWLGRVDGLEVPFAWGFGGQMVFVVPARRMTVVMTSDPAVTSAEGGHLRQLHALLAEAILPAVR